MQFITLKADLARTDMVSFQAPLSPNQNNKRKYSAWEDEEDDRQESFKRSRAERNTKSLFDIELHLETPLPLEWQRCLDIQSGKIHFYNSRTQKRTSHDPRRGSATPDPPSSPRDRHMSLNLELNLLPCDSPPRREEEDDDDDQDAVTSKNGRGDLFMESRKHRRFPSWLAFERGDQQQEMVATVCSQCHMLVMLCKSSPACPNCKFMHPPAQLRGSCKLLC